MGQLVTTIVGGVIGFMIGGPLGASIGMTLGGMIGATLFGPTIKGPRLNDLKVSASTYGIAIPEIYGTVRIGGNLIWTSGINEVKKTSRAGKGGPKQTTYTYNASFAMGICKGEITDVTRIWADSKLIYDKTNNTTRTPLTSSSSGILAAIATSFAGNNKKKQKYSFRVYRGDEEQLPDSLIEAAEGTGNVSGHRGIAYIVFEKMPLADFGNRIPQFSFEVTKAERHSFPSIVVTDSDAGSLDHITSRIWFPDWDNGRLFTSYSAGSSTEVINLDTMRVNHSTDDWSIYAFHRYGYAPYANLFVKGNNLSNSGSINLYDLSTLSFLRTIGVNSNSLSGFYYSDGPRKGRLGLANAFDNDIGVTADGGLIVLVAWTRYVWIITPTGTPVGWYRAPHESTYMFPAAGSVYGWRNGGGGLQLYDYISGGVGTYDEVFDSPDTYWEPGPAPANTLTLKPFAGENYVPQVCLYDETDGCIFSLGWTGSGSTPCVFKYNLATNTYKFKIKHAGIRIDTSGNMEWSRIAGGTFGWLYTSFRQTGYLHEIDLQTGELLRQTSFGNTWGDQLYAGDRQHWDDLSSSLVVETRNAYRRIFFTNTVEGIKLSDVVKDIAKKSNVLIDADIDVTGLDDQDLIGFSIDRECSARDALKLLATGYLFDAYESDYKLKFRSRGDASQVTIPESWVARTGDTVVKETLTQELEMPLKINVNHYDVSRDHQQGTQSARRNSGPFPTMWTAKEDIIDLPISLTPTQAKQTADKLLKMAWANRTGLQFTLPWRYLKYDPTDIATVTVGSATYTLRLTEMNIGADFSIEANAVSEKAAAYVSTAVGNAGESPPQVIPGNYPAYPIIINTPLLRDEDYDTSRNSICYVSAGTYALNFDGVVVYMDDGIDYRSVGVIDTETVTGFAVNKLGYTTAYEATDEKSILKVRLAHPDAELESITQEDMLNTDANAALVGDEIIQFRTAVEKDNGEWWLTGLRRARRGTNYALKDHVAGERFLLLDAAALGLFSRAPDSYVTTRAFKALPDGALITDATEYTASLLPRDLMPYTPEDVKITDDGTNVTLTMQRRSRVNAPLRDLVSTIHYKEGDKLTAKIAYKVWLGLGIDSAETPAEPDFTGTVPLFDTSGVDIPVVAEFPLADLDGNTNFLICLYEVGVVDGIEKWIAFRRLSQDRWNKTDFY